MSDEDGSQDPLNFEQAQDGTEMSKVEMVIRNNKV